MLVRDGEAIGGCAQLGVSPVPDDLKHGRTDILDVVNPARGARLPGDTSSKGTPARS